MDSVIDFLIANYGAVFLVLLGVGLLAYSCFAKRMSFEGDVAVKPEDRETYVATPEMRKYGIFLSLLPLCYGIFALISAWIKSK